MENPAFSLNSRDVFPHSSSFYDLCLCLTLVWQQTGLWVKMTGWVFVTSTFSCFGEVSLSLLSQDTLYSSQPENEVSIFFFFFFLNFILFLNFT